MPANHQKASDSFTGVFVRAGAWGRGGACVQAGCISLSLSGRAHRASARVLLLAHAVLTLRLRPSV